MKYFKISILLIVIAYASNMIITKAYASTPVSWTSEVSSLTHGYSIPKTKTNDTYRQRFKVINSVCSSCTFAGRPIDQSTNYKYNYVGGVSIGSTVSFDYDSILSGDYYNDAWKANLSIIKSYSSFLYDVNGQTI